MLQPSIISKDVREIVPYANNARTHNEEQLDKLVASFHEFGFINPIIVDGKNVIIAGHGRFEAAKLAGYKEVPCVVVSHLSERQVKALRLADNRIAQSGGWDFEKLAEELSNLADEDYDLSVMGFDENELDTFLTDDMGFLPEHHAEMLPTERSERQIPKETNGELVEARPRSSDDTHSTFELVMVHTNKLRLVEVLSKIRKEHGFDKLEDALMMMVDDHERYRNA